MKVDAKEKKYTLLYLFMYLLYLIVLLPKIFQMPIIVFLFLYILKLNNFNICRDKTGFLLSLVGIIQIFAILFNAFNSYDNSRIFASFNTASLWILCGIFYSFVKNGNLRKDKIGKAMFINMCILIIISIIMIICVYLNKTNISFLSKSLMRVDWQYGVRSYRLRAFLLYDTLVPMLYFLIFPFAFEYAQKKISNKFILLIFTTLSLLPVYLSKSRMGTLLEIILYVVIVLNMLPKKKKSKQFLIIFFSVIILLVCVFNYQMIFSELIELLNSRSGSTSTRSFIYRTSIERVLNVSPLLGCGIKEMIGDYPLGSHSTYIGLFYKVGFLGLFVSLIALLGVFGQAIKSKKYYYVISSISLAFMFITEDIDGENWLIILFGILYGLIANYNFLSREEGDVSD